MKKTGDARNVTGLIMDRNQPSKGSERMSIEILNHISDETGFPVKITSDENAHVGMRHCNVTVELEGDDATILIFEPITKRLIMLSDVVLNGDTVDISTLTPDQLAVMSKPPADQQRGTMTTTVPDSPRIDYAKQIAEQITEHHEHRDNPKLKTSLVHRLADDLERLDVNTLHAIFAAMQN